MRFRVLAAAVLFLTFGATAEAQTWPSRTIRVVIPFAAGSATDLIPRVVFEHVSQQLGQPIIVENRPGAGGTTGAAAVAKADPDGYTLLATSSAHTIAPSTHANLSYDTVADFAAVIPISTLPSVFIIAPSKGIKTINELVASGRAKPRSLNFASLGVGSGTHMAAERLRVSAKFDAVHIPFRGGPEALTEIVAGRVDYYACPLSTALPFIRDGRVVALAMASSTRAAGLPDVPTTLEAGFPDSDYDVWVGLFAPAKTPRDIVDRLNLEIAKALQTPAVKEKFAQLAVETMVMSPKDFDAQVAKEVSSISAFAKTIGLTAN